MPVKAATRFLFYCLFSLSGIPLSQANPVTNPDTLAKANLPRPNSIADGFVDTATGALRYEINLMTVQGENPVPLVLEYHSALADRFGTVAPGWAHRYEAKVEEGDNGLFTLHRDGIHSNTFILQDGSYDPLDLAVEQDDFILDNGQYYLWTGLDGTTFEFTKNSNNRLTQIRNKVGQWLRVNGTAGVPTAVLDQFNSNRGKLEFSYNADGRLEAVSDGDQRYRVLEYDDNGLLNRVYNPTKTGSSRYSSNPRVDVPRDDNDGITDTVTVEESGPITFPTIVLRVDQIFRGDLRVLLTAPDGTQVTLHDQTGGQSNNLRFDTRPIAGFYGVERQGDWTLTVIDPEGTVSTGTPPDGDFENWSIRFSDFVPAMEFSYDSGDRLARVEWPAGQTMMACVYDDQGRLVSRQDGRPDTPAAQFSYTETASGCRTTYTDRTGAVTLYDHNADFLLERIEDPLGGVTTYGYDAKGNLVRQTDPAGREIQMGYTAGGLPRFIEYPDNSRLDFEYDDQKNVTEIRDSLGQRTNFVYDDDNNLVLLTDPLQNVTERTYSNNSQIESIRVYAANQELNARYVEFGYVDNMVASALHPASETNRSRVNYDNVGREISRTDADGNKSEFQYNALDNLTQSKDPLGNIATYTYDERGRRTSVTDPRGNTTQFAYDGNDNLIRVTDPLGRESTYEYDAENRLVAEIDSLRQVVRYTYDALGRQISRATPLGNETRYVYNAADELEDIIAPNGQYAERRVYNETGQVVENTDALGYTQTLEYDILGRMIRATDPIGRETEYGYDPLSRPERIIDPLGRVAENTYDSEDVLKSTTDPRGFTTEYEYDAANRLAAIRTPDGEAVTLLYNFRDLPVVIDRPGPLEDRFEYDAAGRMIRHDIYENANPTVSRDYAYDAAGNLTEISGGNATLTREYDALNRMVAYTDVEGDRIEYEYNETGLMTALVYPDGKRVEYTYDADERLTGMTDWAGRETRYQYNQLGQVVEIEFPNGARRTIQYDRRGSPILRRELEAGGAVIRSFAYTYDPAGQLNAAEGNLYQSFIPDAVTYTYDSRNRLATVNGLEVEYNAVGQITSGALNGVQTSFGYNFEGLLDQAGADSYGYDLEDRLRFTFEDGEVTYYTVSPHHPLNQVLVQSPLNGEATYYVYGIGLAYEVQGDEIRVYHYDHLGNTVALSGHAGSVIGELAYSPYGQVIFESGFTDTPFQFHGLYGVHTMENGLVHMRYRFYSPELRRFLTEDAHLGSIYSIESLNRHAFAHGNPIQNLDPEGEFIHTAVGALAGAIGGVVAQGVSDLITGELSSWEQYAGSAVGGAVTGALLVNTFNPVLAGAAGAAAGDLTTQGLNNLTGRQSGFDLGSFALNTAIGGAGGALGAGLSKGAGAVSRVAKNSAKRGVNRFAGRVIYRINPRPAAQAFNLTSNPVAYLTARETASQAAKFSGKGVVKAVLTTQLLNPLLASLTSGGDASQGEAPDGSRTQNQVRYQSLRNLRSAPRDIYGEFLHYQQWAGALGTAQKPLPNSPNHRPFSL